MKTITMKFGGTSVGSVDAISNVVEIVKSNVDDGHRVAIVISAMSGVTDSLIESIDMAINSDKWGYLSLSEGLMERHQEAINELISDEDERENASKKVAKLLEQHVELCNAVNILGEATPRIRDNFVSFGERMSIHVVAAALRKAGVEAKAIDAGNYLITDDTYQNAEPLWEETKARIQRDLIPIIERGVVPVITGFVGNTPDGIYTTLGRGGSDYSAAIFAAYLNSDEFIIWTDVDGVMTTDPRIDKRAQVLPTVSYQEVGELAYYGAKVLHPKTVQPIISKGIPMRVRNTFNPDFEGTLITEEVEPSSTIIKAVTSIRDVSMLTVSGRGMLGVPGIAGRTFLATSQAGASILMISQSSSEQSFCFTVAESQAEDVKIAVEGELSAEIARQNVDGVEILEDIIIITVVGGGMRGAPGVAGRVFTVLGASGVNVLAIAQGSSECSISFIIAEADMKTAVMRLHDLALESVNGE